MCFREFVTHESGSRQDTGRRNLTPRRKDAKIWTIRDNENSFQVSTEHEGSAPLDLTTPLISLYLGVFASWREILRFASWREILPLSSWRDHAYHFGSRKSIRRSKTASNSSFNFSFSDVPLGALSQCRCASAKAALKNASLASCIASAPFAFWNLSTS